MESLLTYRPDELVKLNRFKVLDGVPDELYSIRLYDIPKPDRVYAAGIDTALGIKKKDRDTMVILDRETWPYKVVAVAVGHLGESFHKVVYGLCRMFYNNVFIVAERAAMGLATLRSLRDQYAYTWLYYEELLDEVSKQPTNRLGYAKTKGSSDPCITALRQALVQDELDIPDEDLIDELSKCQFKARDSMEPEEALDADMKVKLARGGSPDLMMAMAYANYAVRQVVNFPKPMPKYEIGTAGQILGHDDLEVKPAHDSKKPASPNPYDRSSKATSLATLGRK